MRALVLTLAGLLLAGCASGTPDEGPNGAAARLFGALHEPLPTSAAEGGDGVGDVIVLTPVPCAAVSRSDHGRQNACPEPLLRSGSVDGREFVAAMAFDLSRLPPAVEVLYAGLELTGLDAAFLEQAGQWHVRMIDVPSGDAVADMSFSRLVAAPDARPGASWRLRAAELAPGGRNALEFDDLARDALAVRLGRGSAVFRIEGPTEESSLFGWAANGDDAPRLRIGYVAMPDARVDPGQPLVVWDAIGEPGGATHDEG